MLSRSSWKNKERWAQADNGACDYHPCFRLIVLAVRVLAVGFLLVGFECQAAQNQKCAKALELMAAQGFQKGSAASLEKDICAVDIASYASLVEFVLSENGGTEVQELEARLLKSAESGNISAKIIYTLVFTDIFNGKFDSDLSSERSYSRYVPYISSVYLFGQWSQDHKVEWLHASNDLLDEAIGNGVLEAYLFEYIFGLLYYNRDRNVIFGGDAATSLLIFTSFFGKGELARSHLNRLFSFSGAELEGLEETVRRAVGLILINPDNAACALRIECVVNMNLTRLICQVRDPNGLVLLNINEPSCTRLAQPFADLYRHRIDQMFTEILSATQH